MLVADRWRRLALAGVDAGMWVAAVAAGMWARYDFAPQYVAIDPVVAVATIAVLSQWVIGAVTRLYRGGADHGSFEEALLLAGAAIPAGLLAFCGNALGPGGPWVPRSVPLAATFGALVGMSGTRVWLRKVGELALRPDRSCSERVLVFGAGRGGRQLVRSLMTDRTTGLLPVGMLDDDPAKRNLRISSVPVLGPRDQLQEVADRLGVETLVIAVPSAEASLVRELSELAGQAGLIVKVVPGVPELLNGRVNAADIRGLDLADLLGRRQIDTDVKSIAGYLKGRRVLVTGAGGSIGSELCRQIRQYAPGELIMLDRDESELHAVQLSLDGKALLDSPDLVLADIRDVAAISEIFQRRRPHIVFHAAALKHLPMLEQYPGEAVQTNVWGTLAVLKAARDVGVERFVNISTDKAADPTSVLGLSKRIAERLTATTAAMAPGRYLSVRFGNVLGSRGSMLSSFVRQVAAGGPVTVTHRGAERFFMTVQEAVQLIVQAAAIGQDGEVLVLDMGEPVRIAEVARRLIEQSGKDAKIVYTGLRPGEKVREQLFGAGEIGNRPVHPLITHVSVPPVDPAEALGLQPWSGAEQVCAQLQRLCFSPAPTGAITRTLIASRGHHHETTDGRVSSTAAFPRGGT